MSEQRDATAIYSSVVLFVLSGLLTLRRRGFRGRPAQDNVVRSLTLLFIFLSLFCSVAAETPYEKALDIAHQEWVRFEKQTIDIDGKMVKKGGQEADDKHYLRVADYWKAVNFDLTGKDDDHAWSAAFISWVMKEAGMGESFSYSEWHATYIRNSILARKAKNSDFAYWGYRLSERAPQVGDLVGYRRQGGITFDYQPTVYKSHTDLVVAVRPGEIDVIGGNVKNSVTKKTLRTDSDGKLIDKSYKWFVVMAPTR